MAAFNGFNCFTEDLAHGVHDLSLPGGGGDTLRVTLCAAANVPVAGNSVIADLTQIGNIANVDDTACVISGSAQTAGTYKLSITDKLLEANDTVGPFRYVVVYNDTPVGDPLICWYDYGSEITLAAGESLELDFDDVNGVLTVGTCP